MDGRPGRLVGACLTDQQADGLSMIYSFFEPDDAEPARASATTSSSIISSGRGGAGLPYVYLGYWVEGSRRMAYKIRYRPLERLGPDGWHRFEPDQRELPLRGSHPGPFAKAVASFRRKPECRTLPRELNLHRVHGSGPCPA